MPFSPIVFVPFAGAFVAPKQINYSAYEGAMIAIGGPVGGTIAAVIFGSVGIITDSHLLIALADFGYILNFSNLLPIEPLDGGRIANSVSSYFNVTGLFIGGLFVYNGVADLLFYMIMAIGTYSVAYRIIGKKDIIGRDTSYYNMSRWNKIKIVLGYITLLVFLICAFCYNHKYQKHPEYLKATKHKLKGKTWSELFDGNGKEDFF